MAYIENGGGPARDARRARRVRDRVPEQRSVPDRLLATSTSFCRRRSASRPASPCRSAATTTHAATIGYNMGQQRRVSGQPVGRARQLLRRPEDDVRRQPRPRESHAAALDRAEPLGRTGWTWRRAAFTTRLVGSRVTYTMTPLMFVSALLQYNSANDAAGRQRAPALGISAGQRAVRRATTSSATRSCRAVRPGARQPGADRQDQPAVPVLATSPNDRTQSPQSPQRERPEMGCRPLCARESMFGEAHVSEFSHRGTEARNCTRRRRRGAAAPRLKNVGNTSR